MTVHTLLVLDTIEDRLVPQSLELLGFAPAGGQIDSSRTLLVIPGRDVTTAATELAHRYGLAVAICEQDELYYPNPELLGAFLKELVAEYGPELVCFLHNTRNCQTAAALAVTLGAACITAVESWDTDSGAPVFRRSVANGKLLQSVSPQAPCTLITVLPGAFSPPETACVGSGPPAILPGRQQVSPHTYRPTGLSRGGGNDDSLDEADVVVAAGRGIGTEGALSLIGEFSRIFANAAIGASRPLCDRKWLPYARQIGVTGRTIAPRLYVACGISGAQQHLAGIRGADCIVAINADPDAAICSVADYIVVDDLHAFLPALLQKYRERFNHE